MWWRTRFGDARGERPRRPEAVEPRRRELRPDRVVADEVAVGEGRRLARCRAAAPRRARAGGRRPGTARPRPRFARCGPRGRRRGSSPGGSRAGSASPGATTASRPVSSASRRPTDGRSAASSRISSTNVRSPETWTASGASAAIAARVAGSTVKPSVAAKRTARSIRSASSRKRAPGSPTARRIPAARSARPPHRSTTAPGSPSASSGIGHRVHGEVAPREVLVERVAEGDVVGTPMVGVGAVAPERGDLVDAVVERHGHRPEAVLVAGTREEGEEAIGPGVGRHVPVQGRRAAQQVADAAADQVGLVAAGAQRARDRADAIRDRRRGHRVLRDRRRGGARIDRCQLAGRQFTPRKR